ETARYEQNIEVARAVLERAGGLHADAGVRDDEILRLPCEMCVRVPGKDRLRAYEIEQGEARVEQHADLERWLELVHRSHTTPSLWRRPRSPAVTPNSSP